MWLVKPLYELLPYYYLIAGVLILTASLYVGYGYWPLVCLVAGIGSLLTGLVIWLRRRDYRRRREGSSWHPPE